MREVEAVHGRWLFGISPHYWKAYHCGLCEAQDLSIRVFVSERKKLFFIVRFSRRVQEGFFIREYGICRLVSRSLNESGYFLDHLSRAYHSLNVKSPELHLNFVESCSKGFMINVQHMMMKGIENPEGTFNKYLYCWL
uniref:Uncharacterized protein n=1 Tax=Physcomitrium patens TaxID=3218 RepID=A0A2K1KKR6_PHYPA|nr:hypothetical protein PHYPA_008061 [Physcomitrium patens]